MIACFYGDQTKKHYEEIHRNTFSVTSKYDRVRRLAAVKHYLTRLLFVAKF